MSAEMELERLVTAAQRLRRDGVYVLLSQQARFLNPLVSHELERLRSAEAVRDEAVAHVVELLRGRLPTLRRGIYFPVPIARALRETIARAIRDPSAAVDAVLARFHYEMIHVDVDQNWSWRGQTVAERTRKFFLEHLSWEPEIELYLFEFKVHDGWWDKSYLDAEVTPLVAHSLEEEGEAAWVKMTSGQRDRLDLESLRLDERERLFCRTLDYGEVLFSDALRFRMLRRVSDDLSSLEVAGGEWPLLWPA